MLKTDWNDVKILMAVAEAGSLSRAAVLTGFDVATISRTVAQMERRFGSALFERSRSGAKPTSLGVELFEASRSILSGADAVAAVLKNARRTEGDEVRVCATFGLISAYLVPAFNGVTDGAHPMHSTASRIDVDSLPEVGFIEDGEETADISLVWTEHGRVPDHPPWSGASLSRVGTMAIELTSASSYLQRQGVPEHLSDLRHHKLVRIAYQESFPAFGMWNDFLSGQNSARLLDTRGLIDGIQNVQSGSGISLQAAISARMYRGIVPIHVNGLPNLAQDLWLLVRPRPSEQVSRVATIIANLFGECPDFALR